MYIALVCPYDLRRPGGVKSHIVGLGEALVERGHRVDVIAPGSTDRAGSLPVITCGRASGVGFGGTQIDLTWAPWARVRSVSKRGYDLMHFHTIWNPLVPLQLASVFDGPKVATFHDVPGVDTPGVAAALMGPASELLRRVWLDAVIAVSPSVGSYLRAARYEVIPNGITVPTTMPQEGARQSLLYLGRLEPRKDVATFLRAVATLDSPPPVVIAGDGPLRADLESLARSLGLANVVFAGEVNEAEKWRLLRDASIMVAPSVGGESFGIVLLEAMAAGAIPVAADNPGYHDVLSERASHLLFARGDASALGERLQTILRDDDLRRGLRQWGDAKWPAYEWRGLVDRVQRVYDRAMQRGTRVELARAQAH